MSTLVTLRLAFFKRVVMEARRIPPSDITRHRSGPQMLPITFQLQRKFTPDVCIFCSAARHTTRPTTYAPRPCFSVRRRGRHISHASRRPAGQAVAEQSETTESAPSPKAPPRSRFGGFAAQKTTRPLVRDEPTSGYGSSHASRAGESQGTNRKIDDLDWGDERDKAALGTRKVTNGQMRSTPRQLPTLDDPRLRPPRSGQESDNRRVEVPQRSKEKPQERLADFDMHERAALRGNPLPPSRQDTTSQDTNRQQPERSSVTQSRWQSLKRSARVERQAESFSKSISNGGFKFGLDDAKRASGSSKSDQTDRNAAPWGQHLRTRRSTPVASNPPVGNNQSKHDTPRKTARYSSEFRKSETGAVAQKVPLKTAEDLDVAQDSQDVVKLETLFKRDPGKEQEGDLARSHPKDYNEHSEVVRKRSDAFDADADADIDLERRPRRHSRRRAVQEEDDDVDNAGATPIKRRDKKQSRPVDKYSKADDEDGMVDEDYVPKKERKSKKKAKQDAEAEQGPRLIPIDIPPFISVQHLATALKIRPEEFVQKLEGLGFEQTAMDHVMNAESAGLVAMEFNYEPVIDRSASEDLLPRPLPPDDAILPPRPPVVTIMGHVDHGKTTLLDYLRKSSVAASEHGGITQHIGAFSVPIASANNRLVTFLDTPGHAAFLSMRQRGANVTDIVVLVVAADDSVKPQTIEAIRHAKHSGVQIIVAISKVDKEDADVYRVKQDLIQHDIEVEDFGGSIQAVEVSGKTGQGISDLEEAIITLSDVLEVRAETEGAAEGWVLEAATKLSGRTATVLVRRGTMRPGNVLVAGNTWTRVRNLRNEAGANISEATPGMPVEVDGWRDQPAAGDEVLGAPTESKATSVVEYRKNRAERLKASTDMEAVNDLRRIEAERRAREKEAAALAEEETRAEGGKRKEIKVATRAAKEEVNEALRKAAPDKIPTIYLIVKADVSGSTEAVSAMINSLPLGGQPVAIDILREGVGLVSESDVAHVAATPAGSGFIVNFNQPVPSAMAALAEKSGIRLIDETIIYKVIDDIKAAVEERLPPVITTRVVGEAEAAQVFEIRDKRKASRVAGCRINNGIIARNSLVRVYRGGAGAEGILIFDGKLASLRSQKKDVTEMKKGTECGLSFDGWDDFVMGDTIQCYEEKKERRRLT